MNSKKTTYEMFRDAAKKAFTLAEVLIVVGILGVIAESTIPTLIQNVQDVEFKDAAKKAFSVSASAVTQMKDDQGGSLDYYFSTTYTFKNDFMKYFKVLKDCNDLDCIPSSTQSMLDSTLVGNHADTQELGNDGQFITGDGMIFNIQQGNMGTGFNGEQIIIVVDVNGYLKKPNVFGKDIFAFEVINNRLMPEGALGTSLPASSYCLRSGETTDGYNRQGIGCMANVMQGVSY